MRVLMTGASGMIGTALRESFTADGHTVTHLVRRTPVAPREVAWDPQAGTIDGRALEGHDVAIHLAGAPVAGGRWTEARRRAILDSRERGTAVLAEALAGLRYPPHTLLSASGIGFYGSAREDRVDEGSRAGTGFMAEVVRRWEDAGAPAMRAGIRVVQLRMGPVLAPHGGYLARVLPAFRLGLGGWFGNGRQVLSWISLTELPRVVQHLIEHPGLAGPVNVVSPNPVTNREFTAALAGMLRRPALLPIPGVAFRALLGELAHEVLGGVYVQPRRLLASGYVFRYPMLEGALDQLWDARGLARAERVRSLASSRGIPKGGREA